MNETRELMSALFDVVLPASEQPAQAWMGSPANCVEAPRRSTPPDFKTPSRPVVIYAEWRSRLSGPELKARHRAQMPSPEPAMAAPPSSLPTDKEHLCRVGWWPALTVATHGSALLLVCSILM